MKNAFLALTILLSLCACKVEFKLNGAVIPDELETFTVEYFENRAPLVNPTLSQNFTEALKDRVTNESRLKLESENGDIIFSGTIKGYTVKPMAIQADAVSAETRLTVSIEVQYKNFKNPKENWKNNFSAFQNFDSNSNINDVEEELTKLIIDQITEDVFNKAFSDW